MKSEKNKVPFGKVLHVYTDGASRINPGPSAFSVLFIDEGQQEYHRYSEYLGIKTNNQAEMMAIKYALDKAIEFTRGKIKLYSDSMNAVSWLNGTYCVRSKNIRPIFDDIQKLRNNFELIEFIYTSRKNNKIAICDDLCNNCLNLQEGKNE